MIINLAMFFVITIISYILVEDVLKNSIPKKIYKYINEKNEKYYTELLKYYEKNKKIKIKNKLNIFNKINLKLDKAGIKSNLIINPITVFFSCVMFFFISYILVFDFLKLVLLSVLIAIPFSFIPIIILNLICNYKTEKIEKIFPNFLVQLKNYTKINNDIVSAIKEIKTIEPLQTYINTFSIEINSGIKFENAIENLKEKIEIEVFKNFFENLEYCYLYGGDYTKLIDKSYKIINEIQKEKNIRIQETKSARLVLYILILLNLFVYVTNIKNNYENYLIMQKTLLGNFILYWNFISIWILIILANNVKKFDY